MEKASQTYCFHVWSLHGQMQLQKMDEVGQNNANRTTNFACWYIGLLGLSVFWYQDILKQNTEKICLIHFGGWNNKKNVESSNYVDRTAIWDFYKLDETLRDLAHLQLVSVQIRFLTKVVQNHCTLFNNFIYPSKALGLFFDSVLHDSYQHWCWKAISIIRNVCKLQKMFGPTTRSEKLAMLISLLYQTWSTFYDLPPLGKWELGPICPHKIRWTRPLLSLLMTFWKTIRDFEIWQIRTEP